MISDELIEKFLQNRCSPEEAEKVWQYFQDNPGENDRLLSKGEWDSEQDVSALPEELTDGLSKVMLQEIRLKAYADKEEGNKIVRKPIALPLRRWAAAAAIILIAGAGIWLSLRPAAHSTQSANREQTKEQSEKIANNAPDTTEQWTTHHNAFGREMKLLLPDGSAALLASNSSLRYKTAFAGPERIVYLEGEAFFDIAKDKSKPFRVYSGALSTTVLGTSFRVAEKNSRIVIRLFSGKVAVAAGGKKAGKWENDILLSPGEQLQYDTASGSLAVTRFRQDNEAMAVKHPVITGEKGNLVFNDAPFGDVMSWMEKKYGISIHYDRTSTSDIYISGTVSATDSAPVVLKMIARMNGLEVVEQQEAYVVRKARR